MTLTVSSYSGRPERTNWKTFDKSLYLESWTNTLLGDLVKVIVLLNTAEGALVGDELGGRTMTDSVVVVGLETVGGNAVTDARGLLGPAAAASALANSLLDTLAVIADAALVPAAVGSTSALAIKLTL